jgi:hypothetical protein
LAEFGLTECFPPLPADAAAKAKATPVHSPSPSPKEAPRAAEAVHYKPVGEAFGDDSLALTLYEALSKSNSATAVEGVCGKELYGDFKVAKSAFRAFMEYWLRVVPAAGVEKVMQPDSVKKEAKMIKEVGTPLLKLFTGSDTGEVGDIILEVYEWFLGFHGKEVNAAFYMRSLQYWHAYKFISTAKVVEYGNAGQGQLNQACNRMIAKLQSTLEERAGAPKSAVAPPPAK